MVELSTLEGMRVLVTRSPEQAGQLSDLLHEQRAEVVEVPVIAIGPPDSWNELDEALNHLQDYDWILFASTNAVQSVLSRLDKLGKPMDELRQARLAAVGPATAGALTSQGLTIDFIPSKYVGEGIVSEFPGYPQLKGVNVLWPRTNIGRAFVAEKLREFGARVQIVQAYKTSEPENKEEIADLLAQLFSKHEVNVVALASTQSTINLFSLLSLGLNRAGRSSDSPTLQQLLTNVAIASVGPETSAAVMKHFGKVTVEAEPHTMVGLVESLQRYVTLHRLAHGG